MDAGSEEIVEVAQTRRSSGREVHESARSIRRRDRYQHHESLRYKLRTTYDVEVRGGGGGEEPR